MYVLSMLLLVTSIQAQKRCSCSCCLGPNCAPVVIGSVDVGNCSTEICAAQCRCTYPQCAANYPYGQVFVQCAVPVPPLFNCECRCCNTGSFACIPMLVGNSIAYICDKSSCALACNKQYPSQCVPSDQGQTQGDCVGQVITTTTTTPIPPWLGYLCSCTYCQSGPICSSGLSLGVSSASTCSAPACTQACQSRNPSICSLTYLNQISGTCLSESRGKIKCKCNCCSGYSCLDYEISSNETCTACYGKCLQLSPCVNTNSVTYTCTSNSSMISINFILWSIILSFILCTMFEC